MKIRMLISLMSLAMLQGCLSVLPEPETPSGLYRLGEIEPSATLTRSLVVRQPEGGRVYGGKALAAVKNLLRPGSDLIRGRARSASCRVLRSLPSPTVESCSAIS